MMDKETGAMMEYSFREELSPNELTEAEKFYDSLDQVTIEQHPRWDQVNGDSAKRRFFFSRTAAGITCFAIIHEKNYYLFKHASISFGPIFADAESLIASIIEIQKFYKRSGFSYLSIQLAFPAGSLSEFIESRLNQAIAINYAFDRNNWSSLLINLSDSMDVIWKGFSKGHKSAIKKSMAEGVTVRRVGSVSEMHDLGKVYLRMNIARKLPNTDWEKINRRFASIWGFLNQERKGFVLGVFDNQSIMVGGIIVIFQGHSARYYLGASDPERKEISILHVALFEAIKTAREDGFKSFDLWGYNHFVNENDQVFYINRFKKGFSDNFLFYPKLMHIGLKPLGYYLARKLPGARKRFDFLRRFIKRKS